ncbi:hypothetical protein J4402_02320 [Candidatus Pacearchaeota archaeon]|nr:hypothetical protein [uncultured archaeon]AQS31895.1 hypothetical protein [uncultured archaeon]MBS3088593.1 hypothetical protein [Candidatus Pacearchaeota archaeon]
MINDESTYDIYYDKEGDFLEVSFGEPATEGTTEEVEQGIFVTRDITTNQIKNIGILDFRTRVQILRKILKQFNLNLPLEISFYN